MKTFHEATSEDKALVRHLHKLLQQGDKNVTGFIISDMHVLVF